MTIEKISNYISNSFPDTVSLELEGDYFFHYSDDKKFPFATIVTHDNEFDNASNLNRSGVYRLNIGVGKEMFKNIFPEAARKSGIGSFLESGFNFQETDKIFPHPMYGNMYWICVLNPSDETFLKIVPYLKEAFALRKKHTSR